MCVVEGGEREEEEERRRKERDATFKQDRARSHANEKRESIKERSPKKS